MITDDAAVTARALSVLIGFLTSRIKDTATATAAAQAAIAAGNVSGAATNALPPRIETTVCLVAQRLSADSLKESIAEAAKVGVQLQFVIIGISGGWISILSWFRLLWENQGCELVVPALNSIYYAL